MVRYHSGVEILYKLGTDLEIRSGGKLGISEQGLDLRSHPDLVGLVASGFGSEGGDQVLLIPGLDVVVFVVPAVDVSFDGVAVVADYEAVD